jgi:hypothetical protein
VPKTIIKIVIVDKKYLKQESNLYELGIKLKIGMSYTYSLNTNSLALSTIKIICRS